jgi:hypothetical protein
MYYIYMESRYQGGQLCEMESAKEVLIWLEKWGNSEYSFTIIKGDEMKPVKEETVLKWSFNGEKL